MTRLRRPQHRRVHRPPPRRAHVHDHGEPAQQNGSRVGDAVLAPGWTDYAQRVLYQTHDVSGLLRDVQYAPTFAFIDQFDAEVKWPTLRQIAEFRRGKTKAEMWILFATSFYPRGLNIHGDAMNPRYSGEVTAMLGSDEWMPIAEGRRRGLLDQSSSVTRHIEQA